jgi:hypothetical protein
MSKQIPFQFSLLQYVFDTFSDEKLNIGLALLSPESKFFNVKLLSRYSRITSTFPDVDGPTYFRYISKLQRRFDSLILDYEKERFSFSGESTENISELLNRILPIDDSSVKFGQIHSGFSVDLEETFSQLYENLIEKYNLIEKSTSIDEMKIWHNFSKLMPKNILYHNLKPISIPIKQNELQFEHGWKNSHYKAIQPISFDLQNETSIKSKALRWFGTNVLINRSPDISNIYYLLSSPTSDKTALKKAYSKAKDLIGTGDEAHKVEIIETNQNMDFAREISAQICQDISTEDND